jgi:hypothetical protein
VRRRQKRQATAIRVDTPESNGGSATIYEPPMPAIGKQVNSRFDCRSSGYTVAGGNDWTTRFQASVLAVCVGFVFSIAAASRNPRFQAARYGLTRAELAPADRASFGWRFPLFHPITLDVCRQAQLPGHGLSWSSKICLERRQ